MTKHYDIKCPSCKKDLGLTSNSDGTWSAHIPCVCHYCEQWFSCVPFLANRGEITTEAYRFT